MYVNSTFFHLRDDVIRYTWIHERYGCDGLQQRNRTAYFFEYPSVVALMTHTIRCKCRRPIFCVLYYGLFPYIVRNLETMHD